MSDKAADGIAWAIVFASFILSMSQCSSKHVVVEMTEPVCEQAQEDSDE